MDNAVVDAFSLRRRILELEGYVDVYRVAVSLNHWRIARRAYESCLSLYARERSDPPARIRCWGVELLIAESKLEEAMKAIE